MKRKPTTRPSTPEASGTSAPAISPDVETLQAQLKLCRAQNAYLHRELAALKQSTLAETNVDSDGEALRTAYTALREQYAILAQHHADLQKRYEAAKHREECLHKEITTIWAGVRAGRGWPTQSPLFDGPVDLDAMLTNVLTLAHPDKWSQGQPATELAHEITVVINALRERLGGAA